MYDAREGHRERQQVKVCPIRFGACSLRPIPRELFLPTCSGFPVKAATNSATNFLMILKGVTRKGSEVATSDHVFFDD